MKHFFYITIYFVMACTLYGTETGTIKLTDSVGTEQLNFTPGSTLYVSVEDADQNTNSAAVETVTATVSSETETTSESVTLTETGVNTGIFMGSITFEEVDVPIEADNRLQVQKGEKLTGTYVDPANVWNTEEDITDIAFYSVSLISGTISTDSTWSKVNSPYLITGDVSITDGITLTIDPGVEVRFVANSEIYIEKGILRAMGNETDSIIFTSNSETPAAVDWYGIRVNSNISPNRAFLDYCRIEYNTYGLHVGGFTHTQHTDTVSVQHSLFRSGGTALYHSSGGNYRPIFFNNNTVQGANALDIMNYVFYVEAISNTVTDGTISIYIRRQDSSADDIYTDNIEISGNTLSFSDNYNSDNVTSEPAILYTEYNTSTIVANTVNITNNTIKGPVYYGIQVYGNDASNGKKTVFDIAGNNIEDVKRQGIYAGGRVQTLTINNNTIANAGSENTYYNNSNSYSGIYISSENSANINIVSNIIDNAGSWGMYLNQTVGRIDSNIIKHSGFGGIYLGGNSTARALDTLMYNTITGSVYPYSYDDTSYPEGGSGIYNTSYSNPVINNNNLIDNDRYEIYNNGDQSIYSEINAKYNYWGSVTNAEIAPIESNPKNLTRIYDKYDNSLKGWVDYSGNLSTGILPAPPIPVNLSATDNSFPTLLTWSAVKPNNILKYNIYRDNASPASTYIASVISSAGQDTFFVDKTVEENTTYYYRITAEGFADDESGFSNEVNITTGVRPTWHVSTSGSDSNDGSAANPFKTVQKAIDTSYGVKDTILILPGTYMENVSINEGKSLVIGSNFMRDNDTSNVSATIIDGNQIGSPIAINDSAAVIKLIGMTLTGGKSAIDEMEMSTYGSGIRVIYADSLILDRMIVKDNESNSYGGGIYCQNTNYFSIGNSWIHNNNSNYNGGGVAVRDSVHYFAAHNSIVSSNTAGSGQNHRDGGGLHIEYVDKAIMTNNVIAFNNSYGRPGLYYSAFEDSLLLLNNIFYNNDGYAEWVQDIDGNEYITAISNYFDESDNNAMSNYGRDTLNINVHRNPFINSGENNFALSESSRGINAGILSTTFFGETITAPSTDIHGNTRPYPADTNPDMGAIENSLGTPMIITHVVNKDGTGDFTSIQSAIDTALSFDHILVMPGNYAENIDFNGKNIVVKSSGGPTATSISPFIDGVPIVWFHSSETLSSILDGFTIREGTGTRGSGINFSGGSATIRNCIITECHDDAIELYYTAAKLKNCLIYNNYNSAFFYDPSDTGPQIINCTITGNQSVGHNGSGGYAPVYKNCIIYNNDDYNVEEGDSANINLGNVSITYSLVEGGFFGTGNLNADPLFVDPENGDFSLQSGSPCIDTGDLDMDGDGVSWQFDTDDQDRDGTRLDMGYSSDYYSCDQCGVCDYDISNNCIQDCTGEWGGSSEIDCNNVCNGTAYLDDCNICSGGNTDHIADSDMNVCGVCFAQYNCEPILLTDENDFTAISLTDSVLTFEFSVPMDTMTFSEITLQSSVLPNIAYHAKNDTGSRKIVHLVLESALASRDTLSVIFPSTLQSYYNYGFDGNQDGTEGDALSFTIYTETLADYNHDNQIDIDDLSIFTSGWYGKEYKYELGPVSGSAPNFIPNFDSNYNIEDMSALMLMWNWANEFASPRMSRYSMVNYPPEITIDKDILEIDLSSFHDISTMRIQLNTLSPDIRITEISDQSTFDLLLPRKWEEENIYEWNFANFSEKGIEEIDICRLESNIAHNQKMLIDYKISSLSGTILSSGSMALEYVPVPDKFILHSAYPNPFNPTTQLKYGLSKNVHVRVAIYDIVGRKITELINKKQQAGYHTVMWNGNQNASGIYFVKMEAGDFISSQKLMLVK